MKHNEKSTVSTTLLNKEIVIVTENANRQLYIITANNLTDIIDDSSERKFIPPDNATVFFAAVNKQPVNPYDYRDFGSLMEFLYFTS